MSSSKQLMFHICLLILICGKVVRGEDDYEEGENVEKKATHTPIFTSRETDTSVNEKETIKLHCSVDNLDGFVLMWKKGAHFISVGAVKLDRHNRTKVTKDHTLIITQAIAEDSGEYICQISTDQVMEQIHVVRVLVPPSVKPIPPSAQLAAKRGETVSIGCNSTGNPPPRITWEKDGGELSEVGDSITFSSIQPDQAGTYTCTAKNSVAQAQTSISVQVDYVPGITVDNNWIHSGEGVTTDITCTVKAVPAAQVHWERGNKPITTSGYTTTKTMGPRYTLTIRNVQPSDFDNYTCVAVNKEGTSRMTVEVSGLAKPVQFISDAKGDKDTSYTIGFSVESYSPVINYKLKFRPVKEPADDWIELTVPPTDETAGLVQQQVYEILGLTPSTFYEAKATAQNKFGWNKESDIFRFHTLGADRFGKMAQGTGVASHVRQCGWTVMTLVLAVVYYFH